MERNYLLVFHNKLSDTIKYQYFVSYEDMKDYIRVNLSTRRYWKVLHKYKISEVK